MYANGRNVTNAIELRKWLLIMHLNGNVEADRQLTSQLTSRFGEFAGWLYLLYTALPNGKVSGFYKIFYFIEPGHAVKSVQTLFEISL